jgi:tRNA1Val (adenine37-N6)-methyltransferase
MKVAASKPFRFKQFEVMQSRSAMKVGTDGVLLAAWAMVSDTPRILDAGSGTGVIALICAQRNHAAQIEAIEIDSGSAQDARENFSASPWSIRLRLHEGDFLRIASGEKFDLIISNPPYFSDSLRAINPSRSAARHDDSLPAPAFMLKSSQLLARHGRITVIFPKIQLERWSREAARFDFYPERICHVFTLPTRDSSRVMVEFSHLHPAEPKMESILIEKSPGLWSEAYKDLMRDYFIKH